MPDRREFLKQGALASALLLTRNRNANAATRPYSTSKESLPDEYFRRLAKWCPQVQARLQKEPAADLKTLETTKGWYHFPYTILPAAVLYAKRNPANPHYRTPEMLQFALQIGDLLVREDQRGTFAPRLDSYRDTYMWVEAYALLKAELGQERRTQWADSIERNISLLQPELASWRDSSAYTENFLGTSPNHFAWWAATLLVGGVHLEKNEWIELGKAVLQRFAVNEQNPDGYWGEHNPNGPTGGYNYLTTLAVGVYWEHTHDPLAMRALRRATDFHSNFTYSDGNLIELFNDRNRYWEVSPWGQFAFSHFPDGRSYAQMLTKNIPDDEIDLDTLGLLAQDALYYHAGPVTKCPQDLNEYVHRLQAPGGVRKRGPWMTALCGIVDTPLPRSQWFLDRQANVSLFHENAGLILCGANSKHQPELATFSEKIDGEWDAKPKGGRLTQSATGDTLAVAHNSFSAEIFVPPSSKDETQVLFRLSGRGPVPEEAYLGVQLCLKPGETLETGTGRKIVISEETIRLTQSDLGGFIKHGGWTLHLQDDVTFKWPVFPYNPYRNGPETKLEHAVALLQIPLNLKQDPKRWLRPNERTIRLRFSVPSKSGTSKT